MVEHSLTRSNRTAAAERDGQPSAKTYHLAVLSGDGIGPEVMDVALEVLDCVAQKISGLSLHFTEHQAGAEHFRRTGVVFPDSVLDDCRAADAVLLSAIGLPDVRRADGTEVQPEMMIGLRRALGLYAAARPVKLYPGVNSPLANVPSGIDFVIVRENLEGLFASFDAGTVVNDQVATDTLVVTRDGTRKAVEYAFRLADRRRGRPIDGRKRVTCVDKANVFRSYAFFRKVFFDVAAEYPHIDAEAAYVDAVSMYMVQDPSAFDVLVMENQFGDILSDLGAGIVGGLGLAPSAEIGAHHALFQPSHGSAPKIAGKNIANPVAMVLSAAMMLDWLGERHGDPRATAAADLIEIGVESMLLDGSVRTPDMRGVATTTDVGKSIIKSISGLVQVPNRCVPRLANRPHFQVESGGAS
jgi:3-isopropylmalate dehydrogenase